MAHAYTPGLQVIEALTLKKVRTLPISGEVVVRVGEHVRADTVIATAKLPSDVVSVNVVNLLGIMPREIHEYMLKKEGDEIREKEPIAETRPLIKWFKTVVRSPIDGTVETVSDITGQVLLRKPPRVVELMAYIEGKVVGVEEKIGAEIQTTGTFIQGIFGIGGEQYGELKIAVERPSEVLKAEHITVDYKGKLLVGGALVEEGALRKALEVGVKGIIVGGVHARDIKELLGYDLGVAITGDEDIDLSLIVTEGFGQIAMADRTFNLLKEREGSIASLSGRTQIRAGVMRPEIIIPLPEGEAGRARSTRSVSETGVKVGDEVRIIREPYFGRLGRVKSLPPALQKIETEAKVRVMEVELKSGESVVVPRANVEIIEV
jgi:hypothetical protein